MIKKAVFAFFILLTCYFGNSALASEAKDQYIVKFKDTSTEAAKNLNIPNRDITYDFSFGHMSVVKLNESDEKKMRNSDKVEYIIKNREVNRIPESKNVYNEDYYLPLPYNMKQIQLNKIGYLGLSGKKVKLAILDSGVDSRHQDLKVSNSFTVFDSGIDGNPYRDPLGHGTHIAGIIAAKENEIGITGIAPNTEIFSGKIIDHNDKTDTIKLLKGMDWAIKNKVDIINLSLYVTEDNKAVKEALDFAYNKKNIIIVAAAGNFGNIIGKGDNITFPARYDSVISVASNDINGERSLFSSTGPKIDITAPGSDIISTYPPNNYRKMSGTSMATPHVASAAALLKEKNPSMSASDIRRILINSCEKVHKNNNLYGNGFLRLENALTFDYIQ